MHISFGTLLNSLDVFILVFIRMTGLFVTSPIFGRKNVPVMLKIGFSFFLALILMNTIPLTDISSANNIYGFVLVALKEFLVGLTLGYVAYLIFTAIYIAGQLIDMQIGFGMVNVLDPVSNIQVPVTSNFYFILSMLVFLIFNGHHALIIALYKSYDYISLGGLSFNNVLVTDIISLFGHTFELGFQICAPIITAILVTDIVLGVMSKTIPQLNVFVVGMPLKILLGVAIIYITIPAFVAFINVLIGGMNNEIYTFMQHMGK